MVSSSSCAVLDASVLHHSQGEPSHPWHLLRGLPVGAESLFLSSQPASITNHSHDLLLTSLDSVQLRSKDRASSFHPLSQSIRAQLLAS